MKERELRQYEIERRDKFLAQLEVDTPEILYRLQNGLYEENFDCYGDTIRVTSDGRLYYELSESFYECITGWVERCFDGVEYYIRIEHYFFCRDLVTGEWTSSSLAISESKLLEALESIYQKFGPVSCFWKDDESKPKALYVWDDAVLVKCRFLVDPHDNLPATYQEAYVILQEYEFKELDDYLDNHSLKDSSDWVKVGDMRSSESWRDVGYFLGEVASVADERGLDGYEQISSVEIIPSDYLIKTDFESYCC